MTRLATEIDLGPGDIVLDGDQLLPPPKKKRHSPNFRSMSVVAERLDGSKCHLVPLGTEVGLGPGHIVLHGE